MRQHGRLPRCAGGQAQAQPHRALPSIVAWTLPALPSLGPSFWFALHHHHSAKLLHPMPVFPCANQGVCSLCKLESVCCTGCTAMHQTPSMSAGVHAQRGAWVRDAAAEGVCNIPGAQVLENYRRMHVPESAPEVTNEEEPIRTAVLYHKVQVMISCVPCPVPCM